MASLEEEHGGEQGHGHGEASGWHHFVAGTVGGISLVFVGYPMDTIKVRLQTAAATMRPSVWQAVRSTVKHEGFLGFYRGVLSPLAGVPPQYAISFGSRGLASALLPMDPNSMASLWIAGGISGAVTTVSTHSAFVSCLMRL